MISCHFRNIRSADCAGNMVRSLTAGGELSRECVLVLTPLPRGADGFSFHRVWLAVLACFAFADLMTALAASTATTTLTNASPPWVVSSGEPLVLRTAGEVRRLTREEADKMYPVRLEATVTCFDHRTELFFVQDDTGGAYIYAYKPEFQFTPGQRVEVIGKSKSGRFSPIVLVDDMKALQKPGELKPRFVTMDQLMLGQEDSQYVELDAIVRSERSNWGHLVLELASGPDTFEARVLNYPQTRYETLVDRPVRVQGVAATHYNQFGQLTGFHLIVPDLSLVRNLGERGSDAFERPIIQARKILTYSSGATIGSRLHVRGVVTLVLGDRHFVLQDHTGGLPIRTSSEVNVKVGDTVDVTGYPAPGPITPSLESSIVKLGASGPLAVEPKPVTPDQAMTGGVDHELVRLEGVLEEVSLAMGQEGSLYIRSPGRLWRASVPPSLVSAVAEIPRGSRVQLTGVCLGFLNQERRPLEFTVFLRSLADVRPLHVPSWWTPNRMAFALGAGSCLWLLGILWVVMLRTRVARKTDEIRKREAWVEKRYRELFENAYDVIFACDEQGRLVELNLAGRELLGFSTGGWLGQDLFAMVASSERAVVKSLFASCIRHGSAGSYRLTFTAATGREFVLQVRLRTDVLDGGIVGIRGIADDITEQVDAEEALRRSQSRLREALDEQVRLGRDLHDGLIQSIYAVGLELEDCRREAGDGAPAVESRLARVATRLNGIIREVRDFIVGLEPELVRSRGFYEALHQLLADLGAAQPERLRLRVDPTAASLLSAQQTTQTLFIAREAVSNSMRHSLSKTTTVSLQLERGSVLLEVHDDGCGFDPGTVSSGGHGLRNISARAREMNASLEISSVPSKGTTVRLVIAPPLPHATN